MAKKYWLMKSEPDVYSIDALKKDKTTWWEGVRNYQARNFMNEMAVGDEVLFYHSSAEPPGVAGIARVTKAAEPDKLQFDKKSDYYEPKATPGKPTWFCVQIGFVAKFAELIPLEKLRAEKKLADMKVLQKGQRLSVQPVTAAEFELVRRMGGL